MVRQMVVGDLCTCEARKGVQTRWVKRHWNLTESAGLGARLGRSLLPWGGAQQAAGTEEPSHAAIPPSGGWFWRLPLVEMIHHRKPHISALFSFLQNEKLKQGLQRQQG